MDAARAGAHRLVSLGHAQEDTFVVPRYVPPLDNDEDPVSFGWCHGAAGTSQLFGALRLAGVDDVAGRPPRAWQRAALRAVRAAGVPERLRPGFWDNDGRCCGTAGVGEVALDLWQRDGCDEDLEYAGVLADALVARALGDGDRRWWQFLERGPQEGPEHNAEQPVLPPGIGWTQGGAGIAAHLLRLARLLEQGADAPAVARPDSWWATDPGSD